jgi:hypothetical protein
LGEGKFFVGENGSGITAAIFTFGKAGKVLSAFTYNDPSKHERKKQLHLNACSREL